MNRKAKIVRKTKETNISVEVNLDGKGVFKIDTKIGFLNHMLEQLSKHSLIDLKINAKGDTHIDLHHTTEDTGIAVGECIKKALKSSKGIKRYANALIPMDETLTRIAIDISNRPYLIWKVKLKVEKLGEMDTELFKEWFQAFSQAAGITLHVENVYGDNSHHIIESCFKQLKQSGSGLALCPGCFLKIIAELFFTDTVSLARFLFLPEPYSVFRRFPTAARRSMLSWRNSAAVDCTFF